jgi:hypothetical protein
MFAMYTGLSISETSIRPECVMLYCCFYLIVIGTVGCKALNLICDAKFCHYIRPLDVAMLRVYYIVMVVGGVISIYTDMT